jgi:hypothetical protein
MTNHIPGRECGREHVRPPRTRITPTPDYQATGTFGYCCSFPSSRRPGGTLEASYLTVRVCPLASCRNSGTPPMSTMPRRSEEATAGPQRSKEDYPSKEMCVSFVLAICPSPHLQLQICRNSDNKANDRYLTSTHLTPYRRGADIEHKCDYRRDWMFAVPVHGRLGEPRVFEEQKLGPCSNSLTANLT